MAIIYFFSDMAYSRLALSHTGVTNDVWLLSTRNEANLLGHVLSVKYTLDSEDLIQKKKKELMVLLYWLCMLKL